MEQGLTHDNLQLRKTLRSLSGDNFSPAEVMIVCL